MENRGVPVNEDNIVYQTLYREMQQCGFRPCKVANMIGIDPHTMLNKLRGEREWKLWECLEIKRVIGSEMTIEALFDRDLTNL